MNIQDEIKYSENVLTSLNITYKEIINSKYSEDFEEHNTANFEAGRLSILYKLDRCD